MPSIYDWSTTPLSNGSSDSGLTYAEGQAPSTLNNAGRQVMGRVAEWLGDIGGALSAGGTANALTVTANSAFTIYANGRMVVFRATNDNTEAATLNVNSIGAKAIYKNTVVGPSALTGGEIQATGIYVVRYQAALNGGAGVWLLEGPNQAVSGTWTPVLTSSSPGNLAVSYAAGGQIGRYRREGDLVTLFFNVQTSSFTYTTAAGNVFLSGLPYTSENSTGVFGLGSMFYQVMSSASRPHISPYIQPNSSAVRFLASGSGVGVQLVDITDIPSGNTVLIGGYLQYYAA